MGYQQQWAKQKELQFKIIPLRPTGALMLASVLKSKQALDVNISVIEIFVKMREMLSANKDILMQMQKVEKKLTAHDEDIRLIFEALKQLLNPPQEPGKRIGFKPDDI
jgi:predicted CoA-binding protein